MRLPSNWHRTSLVITKKEGTFFLYHCVYYLTYILLIITTIINLPWDGRGLFSKKVEHREFRSWDLTRAICTKILLANLGKVMPQIMDPPELYMFCHTIGPDDLATLPQTSILVPIESSPISPQSEGWEAWSALAIHGS